MSALGAGRESIAQNFPHNRVNSRRQAWITARFSSVRLSLYIPTTEGSTSSRSSNIAAAGIHRNAEPEFELVVIAKRVRYVHVDESAQRGERTVDYYLPLVVGVVD